MPPCACRSTEKYTVTMPNGTKRIVHTQVERDSLVSRGGTYRKENG